MSAYFGLDFGSSSFKVAQVSLAGSKSFTVTALGLAQNPAGSLELTDQKVVEKILPSLKALLKESGIKDKRAVVSVPESRVFSRIVAMPNMSDTELASAVNWEAEQFVPVPVNEVEIDYSVIHRPPKGAGTQSMLVYLVAAPKKYLQALVDFLVAAGIEPVAVESEMVAVSRAFSFGGMTGSSLIVHIGALSTVMAIVEGDALRFSYVMDSGGVALTRAVSQSLALPIAQAEEYKRTYGLDPAQLEGKVKAALLVIGEGMVAEIRKAIEYHLTENKSQVSRIVLSGGGAYLPELTSYLGEAFAGLEVMIGDPFMQGQPGRGVVIPPEKAVYSVAVGLSQRVF
ncbi:MAG: type IV pilus assembly protein PilM, nonfunctional [Microgenomates group bacterium GW2011_GWF2_47_9]|nr:MAG: type IV pilus assembly protein PilM, nonfunctional [Microgenomates group bacterium GW2011_GWF2_47_9]